MIKPLLLMGTLTAMLLSGCQATDANAAEGYSNPYKRDLLILSDWFEGEFDNSEQIWYERFDAVGIAEEDRVERLHTTHTRLNLPKLGEHVFYVEEYLNNDPEEIIRVRFVSFESDVQSKAIRMKQGFFKDMGRFLGGKNLDKITSKDLFFIDTCDVFWNRRAGQFEGKMKDKECVFGEGDKRRYSVHDLTLSEDAYWRTDSTYLVSDDSFHKGNKAGRPSQMLKANRFICDVTFKPENTEGMTFLEIRENSQSTKGNSIHSQGGTFVVKREFDGKEFEYLMREKQYPFYAERPEFIYFSMREKGEPYSLSYNVVDLNSRRIGLQAGDFGYNCYREGYTFDESIEQLNKQ